jgi:osmotically-inducible protein OsmY
VEGLSVTYNGNTDTAIIKGQVKSQADKEKIILAVGNIDHVAQVDDQMTVEVLNQKVNFIQ